MYGWSFDKFFFFFFFLFEDINGKKRNKKKKTIITSFHNLTLSSLSESVLHFLFSRNKQNGPRFLEPATFSICLAFVNLRDIASILSVLKLYEQTNATTPNNVPTVNVASVCTRLKVSLQVSNFTQQLPTTSKNMQQDVQTDATSKIQQSV